VGAQEADDLVALADHLDGGENLELHALVGIGEGVAQILDRDAAAIRASSRCAFARTRSIGSKPFASGRPPLGVDTRSIRSFSL